MVKQSCTSANDKSLSAIPACASARCHATAQPSNLSMSRRDIGRKSCTCSAARNTIAFFDFQRGLDVGEHHGRSAVGDQRAIGALERAGDARVLLALGAAEVVAEIFSDLRVRIADAVLVVLGGDARQRIGLIAPALEIKSGDLAENAGETAVDVGLFAHIGGFQQISADLGARRRRHLLGADDKHDPRGARCDRFQALMYGGGTGSAGVLDAGGALEAQIGRGLQHQRSGKILRREAGIEVAEHDLVDVLAATPASASASLATRTIRLSTVSPESLPKGVWAQPTMQAVMIAPYPACRILVAFPWL